MKNLGIALKAWRTEQGIGIRAAAAEIGTSPATLSRLENGKPCDARTLAAVLFWLMKE
jgi:transcriptional regulator with XRE-family HTH domain